MPHTLILRHMTRSTHAARPIENCRFCGGDLLASVFDTVFRAEMPESLPIAAPAEAPGEAMPGDERLFFAIPGALCVPCRQLYVDQQLIGILGLAQARCTFAIESDRVLRAGAV